MLKISLIFISSFALNSIKVSSYHFKNINYKYPIQSFRLRNPLTTYSSFGNDADNVNSNPLTAGTNSARKARGNEPEFAIPGDTTIETPSQKLTLFTHFAVSAFCLFKAFSAMKFVTITDSAILTSVILLSTIIGDFATGVFHWSVDNYGNINTPIFGAVCAAFQGHHDSPWTITFRSFANNVYKICYPSIAVLTILAISPLSPLPLVFFTLFINWWVLSQEFHKYSHMKNPPLPIRLLQQSGIILSRKEHGLHHTSPFEEHYCILTGVCNKFLDDSKFFRHLERIVYRIT
eukprot:gene3201-6321_t